MKTEIKQGSAPVEKFVGLERFAIVKINPTRKELNDLYAREDKEGEEEIEYVTTKDDKDQIRIAFYMKALDTDRIVSKSFFIKEDVRLNKAGTKTQFINQACETSWAEDKTQLSDWFTTFYGNKEKTVVLGSKTIRECTEGEGDFYEFVRKVMSTLNYYSPNNDVYFDIKKMLKGDFKELNTYLCDIKITPPFATLNYIHNVINDEGKTKTYNEIFVGDILNEQMYNNFLMNTNDYYSIKALDIQKETGSVIAPEYNTFCASIEAPEVVFKKEYDQKAWTRFITAVSSEYGCKGYYAIHPVFKYDPAFDITSSDMSVQNVPDLPF